MIKGYKYRIYPTKEQSILIDKHIGACRFVYNLALETKNNAYISHKKNLTCFDLSNQLPDLKNECEWLKEIDSQALQQSITNLDKAFTSFFKGNASFPVFKSKKRGVQSFRNPHGSRVKIKDGKIYQPKFTSGIKIKLDRSFNGDIKSSTISKTRTNKYFCSLIVDDHVENCIKKEITTQTSIGIDLGIKSFITTSEGDKLDNPKFLRKNLSKIKYLQRTLKNKKKGSSNSKKTYFKIALHHEKICNKRNDFLHKESTKLIKNHDTICMEDLNVKGMVKNHKLALSISDASWARFIEFVKYKSEWNGVNLLFIPRFEPSTKICSQCGSINSNMSLLIRNWECAKCNTIHDRDINAALNIKNYCLRNFVGVQRKKNVELPTLVGAMKH